MCHDAMPFGFFTLTLPEGAASLPVDSKPFRDQTLELQSFAKGAGYQLQIPPAVKHRPRSDTPTLWFPLLAGAQGMINGMTPTNHPNSWFPGLLV